MLPVSWTPSTVLTSEEEAIILTFRRHTLLLKDLPADVVLADAAYDSDRLRKLVADKGAMAVIPNNPSRAKKHDLDRTLYKERHLIEGCLAKLKQFRRVATRYEKTARSCAAVVTLAAIVLLVAVTVHTA